MLSIIKALYIFLLSVSAFCLTLTMPDQTQLLTSKFSIANWHQWVSSQNTVSANELCTCVLSGFRICIIISVDHKGATFTGNKHIETRLCVLLQIYWHCFVYAARKFYDEGWLESFNCKKKHKTWDICGYSRRIKTCERDWRVWTNWSFASVQTTSKWC